MSWSEGKLCVYRFNCTQWLITFITQQLWTRATWNRKVTKVLPYYHTPTSYYIGVHAFFKTFQNSNKSTTTTKLNQRRNLSQIHNSHPIKLHYFIYHLSQRLKTWFKPALLQITNNLPETHLYNVCLQIQTQEIPDNTVWVTPRRVIVHCHVIERNFEQISIYR